MKKIVFLLLSPLLVCAMTMAMAETVVTAKPGDTLTLDIVLTSGGGETASVGLKTNEAPVTFAGAVGTTPNDVVPPVGFGGAFVITNLGNVTLSPDGSVASGDLSNPSIQTIAAGQIGTVTFTVNEDAAPGTYTVEAYVILGSVAVDSEITFTIEEDEDEPTKLLGDVNGDGTVDGRDSIRLMKYLLDSSAQIVEINSDVNEDGVIDGRDSIRLMKILLV